MISQLRIHNLRNIRFLQTFLHPKFTFVIGKNGSGKTSFLEAVYLLGCGHSFRARETFALVTSGETITTLYAQTNDAQNLSLQKTVNGATTARINRIPCSTSSELAFFLPTIVFYQDIFNLINDGPAARRELLDWGMFHVEHEYLTLWKSYKKILKQRNSLLKQKPSAALLNPWNQQLADLSEQLHALRQPYCQQLRKEFNTILPTLSDLDTNLAYYQGWDRKKENIRLLDVLERDYIRDCQRMFTHHGAHQADIYFVDKNYKVKTYLSRGQQKICLYALKLAQAKIMKKSCVFLMDDLPAELDKPHLEQLLRYLKTIDGQFIISCRSMEEIRPHFSQQSDYAIVHLDNGATLEQHHKPPSNAAS